ncbi:MAG TPA: carbonic anhydrase [Candidatus Hydrogenedens sp.]|nr:carbonic anhydrase [Candidatus Hydrogenedens sp.]HOK09078.1 carbonic anhydrase [Candidatus Hydrogenedens sp.]HOL19144.1 carbonic anhydrase [Candidatus Hydrogenedens sp.]
MNHHLSMLKPEPDEVLKQLLEGNQRFIEGTLQRPHSDPERRVLSSQVSQADYAIATVLSCSDSRVPPEIIFDCGIMDLFVVRLAGNVLSDIALASIEYGVLHVNTPLLLVMAHSQCGAITAVVDALKNEAGTASTHTHEENTNIYKLFDLLSPVVQSMLEKLGPTLSRQEIINLCAREQTRHIIQQIRTQSPAIAEVEKVKAIKIIPVYYELETGRVFQIE